MAGRKREWLRKRMAAGRIRQFSAAAWRSWRQRHPSDHPRHILVFLQNYLLYNILWFVEAVAVVATICFFYLRFGFRL